MHPSLARLPLDAEFLPEGVIRWRDRVAALPEGANFAALVEAVRSEDESQAERLLGAAARGSLRLVGELSFEQAREEYQDALAQLERQEIRSLIQAVIDEGLETEQGRARYEELTRRLAAAEAPPDDRGTGDTGVLDL